MPEDASPQVEWLYRIARALHYQGLNARDILYTALSLTCAALDVKQACILTFKEDGDLRDALLLGARGQDDDTLWHKLIAEGLVSFVQHGQRAIVLRDVSADSRWPRLAGLWQGSAIGVPLLQHANLYGALVLLHPQVDFFSDEICDFLEEAGGVIAAAYGNARRADELQAEAASTRGAADDFRLKLRETIQVEGLRRDLASMTYHDLRGLLQNVYTSLISMERFVNVDKTAESFLRLAMQSTRQMTRMVKGLLDIDRLEQGRAVINKRRTELHPLLDETMELVRPIAAEAQQSLSCESVDTLPDLQIDPDMITRVLVNLIENAVKHTPANGRVTLRVRVKEGNVSFSVGDTGPGIPENHREEIFDKYYRIRHVDAPSGVGLGLAFCRLAVEAHGGRIWVDNQPGRGAVFTFTLPLEPTATTPPA